MIEDAKKLIGEQAFESVRELVRRAFPDPKAPPPADALVALVINALPEEARIALGIAPSAVSGLAEIVDAIARAQGQARGLKQVDATSTAGYYLAEATHTRIGAGAHEFTGRLPMVRVRLPMQTPTDFATSFGTVFAGDHKVHTVELVRDKYREFFAFPVQSVYLTTPARYLGARFGAIATYEVLDDTGTLRAWILEAGMATGEPMVLYASPHAQPIERLSWYEPTPFSSASNWYRGTAMFGPSGPTSLHVQVASPEERAQKQAHVEVKVAYTKVAPGDASLTLFPAVLTAQAAMRVAAIAVARGDRSPLYLALAPFGLALDWSKRP